MEIMTPIRAVEALEEFFLGLALSDKTNRGTYLRCAYDLHTIVRRLGVEIGPEVCAESSEQTV